jgi:hypothetical protein
LKCERLVKFVEEVFGLRFEGSVFECLFERVFMIDRRNDCDVCQICTRKKHLYIDTGVLLFNIVAVVVKRLHDSSISVNKLTKAVNKDMKRMT